MMERTTGYLSSFGRQDSLQCLKSGSAHALTFDSRGVRGLGPASKLAVDWPHLSVVYLHLPPRPNLYLQTWKQKEQIWYYWDHTTQPYSQSRSEPPK